MKYFVSNDLQDFCFIYSTNGTWWNYCKLWHRVWKEIKKFKKLVSAGENPRDIKFKLAQEIIERFHDKKAAEIAQADFIQRFQKGAMPDDIDEKSISSIDGKIAIGNLLKEAGLVDSTSEAMRMIKQGAVKIDGNKIEDPKLVLSKGTTAVFQVGKRKFAKISLE